MAGLSTGAKAPLVKVYHEKSMILPDVSRVLACLYEKDVKFECVQDSYKDILRLQASRSVPVPFYDGSIYLQDSRSICRYIAETYEYRGYPYLLGKDILERASIEQWLRNEEHAFDPPSRALFCHLAFPLSDEGNDDINREKRKLEEVLEVYEQRLSECDYLAGNKFTLADLVHLPNTHHILTSGEFAYLYDSRKNVRRWWNTISARDSWQQVLMDMKRMEEQYQMEELDWQEQQQWYTEPPPTSGDHIIRIDPKKVTGTKSHTVLVPPPSTSSIATPFQSVQQGEQPMPMKTTSNSIHAAHQTSEAAASRKARPRSAQDPHEIETLDFYETESKPASVNPWVDKPDPFSKPDPQTLKTPYTRPPAQRAAGISGPEASEIPSDQRIVVQAPYAQQHPEKEKMASSDQQAQTAPQVRQCAAQDITKDAREADQRRATSPLTQKVPSGTQHGHQQSKAPATDLRISGLSPLEAEFKEDTHGANNEDDWFSTERLRKKLEKDDPEVLRPESKELQAPVKKEIPPIYKEPSDVKNRERQTSTVSADGETGIPSAGTRAPDTPTSADERRGTSPPKRRMAQDDRAATEPQKSAPSNEQQPAPSVPGQSPTTRAGHAPTTATKSDDDRAKLSTIDQWRHTSAPPPSIQQVSSGAPSIAELAKTPGDDRRAPLSTSEETPIDARNALAPVQGAAPNADGSGKQADKSTMNERAPKWTRQAPPSDTRHNDQIATPASTKQTAVKGEFPDVRDTNDDTTKKSEVDKRPASSAPRQEAVSRSQQTTEPIKGVTSTLHSITGEDPAKIAVADEVATSPAPEQASVSRGRIVSTPPKEGTPDARGKNEADTSSGIGSRGIDSRRMPATPRPPSTPDTPRPNTSDRVSGQAPPLPSFADSRNEKTAVAEVGQINTIAPNGQPDEIVPKIDGPPAAGPSQIKSENESYNDVASMQKLSSDQSRAQPAENKNKQVDDATPLTETGKAKEVKFSANGKQKNTGQSQTTSTNGPPKLQMQSDKNKPMSSNDIGKPTNETADYLSSAPPKEYSPSVPEKSMGEKQLQVDESSISPQDNVKQSPDQHKNRNLLTDANQNRGKTPGEALQKPEEQTSSNAQQVKSDTNKSDNSSKPAQFDGNEGNLPESQRRGSPTNT